jgi:F0F1-type ATP synthase gamma subunit
MPNVKKIHQQLDFVDRFKGFALSYQQVTMAEMAEVRETVLQTRAYMEGLQDVFIDVKNDHKMRIEELQKKNKGKSHLSFSTLEKTRKNAVILFSVSTKFSNFLNKVVIEKLVEYLKKNNADIFVFGKVGESILKQNFPSKKITLIAEDRSENNNMKKVLEKLLTYQNVELFFPKFHNLLNQEVVSTNLTGEESALNKASSSVSRLEENRRFLFEPDIDKILNFFEVEFFKFVFDRSMEESNLAHLGARLTTFESVQQSVDKSYEKTKKRYLRVKKDFNSKKQRERISGILLWS